MKLAIPEKKIVGTLHHIFSGPAALVNTHNLVVEKAGIADGGFYINYKITCACGFWDMSNDYIMGGADGFVKYSPNVPASTCPSTLSRYLSHVYKASAHPKYNVQGVEITEL